jgi:DNA (cytosine-5)-methyltransferase 1
MPSLDASGDRAAEGEAVSLVLSLVPGIGLLDMAFELEGFTVVRGPDLLWGGDVKSFHPPAGRFDGVIGGPPCQAHSITQYVAKQRPAENLIPEFERCVLEAAPQWFVMENVRPAPLPVVEGYTVFARLLNNRWLQDGDGAPEQNRLRRFSFGSLAGIDPWAYLEVALFENPVKEYAVVGGHDSMNDHRQKQSGYQSTDPAKMARLQGLPEDFFAESPFTVHMQRRMLGNGVPLPMGRAVAKAVRRAARERAA